MSNLYPLIKSICVIFLIRSEVYVNDCRDFLSVSVAASDLNETFFNPFHVDVCWETVRPV